MVNGKITLHEMAVNGKVELLMVDLHEAAVYGKW